MSDRFWNGILSSRYTAPISRHPAEQREQEGLGDCWRISIFHSLCQQLGNSPPRLLYGFGRISPSAPGPSSAPCSKAKELDVLSFTKLFMKVSLLNCSKIQKASNSDSLRRRPEGPWWSPAYSLRCLRLSCWKCNFFFEDFFQPAMLPWKLLPFWKALFPTRQLTEVILRICCWDDNILIRYARIFYPSLGCRMLTFFIILRKSCKSIPCCNKNLNFVAYFLCRNVPAPWASLQGINDSSPINQMPKEAPGGGRDVHKKWNGFHPVVFHLV